MLGCVGCSGAVARSTYRGDAAVLPGDEVADQGADVGLHSGHRSRDEELKVAHWLPFGAGMS